MCNSDFRRRGGVLRAAITATAAAMMTAAQSRAQQTTASWINPVSGNWIDASNWSTNPYAPINGTPAGASYIARLSASGTAPYVVSLSSSIAVDEIDIPSPLATVSVSGGAALDAATINLSVTGSRLDLSNGTLNNALVSGSGVITANGAKLSNTNLGVSFRGLNVALFDGLTLHSNALFTADGTLPNGTTGPDTHVYGSQSISGQGTIVINNDSMDLRTIGSAQTVLTVEPGITITNGSTGSASISSQYSFFGKLINQGVIRATGGWFTLDTLSWTNQGTFVVGSNGVLALGGVYSTSDIGHIVNQGGSVILAGDVNNAGQVIQTDATTGSYILGMGGTINGGTLRARDGTSYSVQYGAGSPSIWLKGITLDATVIGGGQGIYVTNGLTMIPGSSIQLPEFQGTQSVTGTGVLFGARINGGTLTIGPNITINGGIAGNPDPNFTGNLINHGTLTGNLINLGFADGQGQFISDGTIDLNVGSTLFLGKWTNRLGTLRAQNGARLYLSGNFTWADLGAASFNNANVFIVGNLDNTGKTLAVNPQAGSITVGNSGTITGGTISTQSGAALLLQRTISPTGRDSAPALGSLTLDGVVRTVSSSFGIPSISLSGGINLTPGSSIYADGGLILSSRLGGTGDVWVSSPDGNVPALLAIGAATFESGITVHVDPIFKATFFGTLTNQGIIRSDNAQTTLALGGQWTNSGVLRVTAGTLELGGTLTTGRIGSIDRSGSAAVRLTADLDNSGATLDMSSGGAPWSMGAGTITGGTVIDSAPGSIAMSGSYLKNLTLSADVSVNGTVRFDHVDFEGATLRLQGSSANLLLTDTNVLDGVGTIIVSGSNAAITPTPAGSLTTGSSFNLLAGASTFLIGGTNSAKVTNLGTIAVNTPGGEVTFNGANQNVLSVSGGGVLRIGGASFSNAGSILVGDGGILNLDAPLLPSNVTGLFRSGNNVVNIAHALDNTGQTLDLAVTPLGPVDLGGGATITGGTLASSTGRPITINRNMVTLDDVTATADIAIENGATLNVRNGLQLTGTRSISTFRRDGLSAPPAAQLLLQPVAGDFLRTDSGRLTLGKGLTVSSNPYFLGTPYMLTVGSAATELLNQGTLTARDFGTTMQVLGSSVTNSGTFDAINRGVLSVADPSTLTNLSGQTLTGGAWAARANSTLSIGAANVTTNNASVFLDGGIFAAIDTLQTNNGTFAISSGRVFRTAGALNNSGTVAINSSGVIVVSPALANTGTVDMNAFAIVDYPASDTSPIGAIAQQAASGFHGGDWNGAGIRSSSAASVASNPGTSAHRTAVGYAEAPTLGITAFAGQNVDTTSVLLRYTYSGDANLDGSVDTLDFNALAANFGGSSKIWSQADFNYDGVVDTLDFNNLASNFGRQLASASETQPNGTVGELVPEPAVLWLVAAGALSLTRQRPQRRRRRSDVSRI